MTTRSSFRSGPPKRTDLTCRLELTPSRRWTTPKGSRRAAGVLVTPPIWFGDSPHHMGRPGTISLRSQTVIEVLKDVYRSLIHHGFRKILTFNGHRLANLPVIQIASKQVKEDHPNVLFAVSIRTNRGGDA